MLDIEVSGLDSSTPVGAVGLTLTFNSAILQGLSYIADPGNKMGVAINPAFNDISCGFGVAVGPVCVATPGTFDLNLFADLSFADNAALFAAQGTGFTLARLTFTTVGLGLSNLDLSNIVTGDVTFLNTGANSTATGSVCVSVNGQTSCRNSVPEPTTALLVATALGGLAIRRRHKVVA